MVTKCSPLMRSYSINVALMHTIAHMDDLLQGDLHFVTAPFRKKKYMLL